MRNVPTQNLLTLLSIYSPDCHLSQGELPPPVLEWLPGGTVCSVRHKRGKPFPLPVVSPFSFLVQPDQERLLPVPRGPSSALYPACGGGRTVGEHVCWSLTSWESGHTFCPSICWEVSPWTISLCKWYIPSVSAHSDTITCKLVHKGSHPTFLPFLSK